MFNWLKSDEEGLRKRFGLDLEPGDAAPLEVFPTTEAGAAAIYLPDRLDSEHLAGFPLDPNESGQNGKSVDLVSIACRNLRQLLRDTLPESGTDQKIDQVRSQIAAFVKSHAKDYGGVLDQPAQQDVIKRLLNDVFDYGPLSDLMHDDSVSDILVNGPYQVFAERRGQLQLSTNTFDDVPHLMRTILQLIRPTGRLLDAQHPMVDVRLSDGSRMNAILNPPALNGPLLSIRRFGSRPLTADDLLKKSTLTPEMLEFLAAAVRGRLNIVISGGTGSGKTTLLNALSRYIRPTERIATIEDTAELELQQPHVIKLESIPGGDGIREVTPHELVKNTLRVRPDRIIIGECRGAEALEMLQAMNTGHEGSMTTIHANSPREVFSRMELMIGLERPEVPLAALRRQMAASIDLVIQVDRLLGGERKVVRITEVTGMEGDTISMHDLFQFTRTGVHNESTVGHFEATGIRPVCFEKLIAAGASLDNRLFAQRQQLSRKSN